MTHGSLFSGIGGFELAAEWMGWENKFHCEWNPFGQKVLKYYWPEAESFEDITKTDFTKYANTIDILTGGFPCQPYSLAGKRKGKDDDRHLWPEMLRAIGEIKPRWVVGENVLGLVNWNGGLVFHEVQSDLEAQGYEVWPYVLPAASVNAPHRRDRVWFVAYSMCIGSRKSREIRQSKFTHENDKTQRVFTNTDITRCENRPKQHRWESTSGREGKYCTCGYCIGFDGDVTNAECIRLEHSKENGNIQQGKGKTQSKRSKSSISIETNGKRWIATDSESERLKSFQTGSTQFQSPEGSVLYGRGSNGKGRGWQNFPTVSPICDGNDGFSDRLDGITFSKWRNESIKAGGNAIVPQVAYQIFKTIALYDKHR